MAWGNLDDGFHDNPTVLKMGNACAGLLARCISYCARHLTDGWIPISWVDSAAETRKQVTTLLTLGELEVHRDRCEYLLVHYLDFNESRDTVLDRKRKADERKRKWREKQDQEREENAPGTRSAHVPSRTHEPSQAKPSQVRELEENAVVFNNIADVVELTRRAASREGEAA